MKTLKTLRGVGLILTIVAGTMFLNPAKAGTPNQYIKMSDDTLIALNIQIPAGQAPAGGWPTIIEIDGYGGGSVPRSTSSPVFGSNKYATVHMSLRGTGCSGGQFNLFDRRSSYDGYQAIEWIADQPWSNGKVAIWGHSYSGLTGWLVASTQPPSLVAMSVSGLIDDLYRGIVYTGGVSNMGFPLLWTGAYRPRSDYSEGVAGGLQASDAVCAINQAGRVPPDVFDNPVINGLGSLGEDSQWWASHSTITYLDGINVPTHIVQSYQDEQTGPRGSNLLWQKLDERKPSLPKRLLLTNGVHSTNTAPAEVHLDRIAWFDCYVRNDCAGDINDQTTRVKVLWEMSSKNGALRSSAVTSDPDWPLTQTNWTRYYLGDGGSISTTNPAAQGSALYASGSKRAGAWTYLAGAGESNRGAEVTTANLADEVRFQTDPFQTNTAFAGPINMTLHASSTAVDTEFYVELNDVDASGNITRLQRGMLKTSHREIDALRTDYNANGDIIRPYRPHTNTTTKLLTPGSTYAFDIEIFPLGHVFRPGHRLLVRVTNPPQADSLAHYVQTTGPAVNKVFFGGSTPSSLLLPIVDVSSLSFGPAIGCGIQVGLERCSKPVL